MLSQKTNKNKNLVLEVILGLIILIVVFLLLKSFVFKSGGNNNEDIISASFDRPESFKPLETDIFNDPKFKKLKDNRAEKIKIEDLNIGRENPFVKVK